MKKKTGKKEKNKPEKDVEDKRFELLNTIKLAVPGNYDHNHQLALFKEKNIDNFGGYNGCITDDHFSKVSHHLVPGETCLIKIFGLNQKLKTNECMAFLRSQNVLFVGAQGLSLLRELRPEIFPRVKWMVSLDEYVSLWNEPGGSQPPHVPMMGVSESGSWIFQLSTYSNDWGSDSCLLCFCRD